MKKLGLVLLGLFTVAVLTGCEGIPDERLKTHIETMDSMNTYVINITSTQTDLDVVDSDSRYVYIDNVNQTFMVTKDVKENNTFTSDDIIFEYENDKLYSYVFEDSWSKIEVDSNYLNIKYFEAVLFEFFKDARIVPSSTVTTYNDELTLGELSGQMYNLFDTTFDEKYFDIKFPVTAYYSNIEGRFTNFEFDFEKIYSAMNADNDDFSSSEASWIVDFSFEEINKDFTVNLNNHIDDDYYNTFAHLSVLQFALSNSFDMINGSVDYLGDLDIMKIVFEESGLYKLRLTDMTSVDDLFVKILDEDQNLVRTLCVNANHTMSDYWSYPKGEYYLVVSSNGLDLGSTDYSFLFISN